MPAPPIPPLVPGAGPLAVVSRDDVLAHMPTWVKREELAPIRDALVDSLLALVREFQYRVDIAAAESDVLRAEGIYLADLADDRLFAQQAEESKEDFRARILAVPALVTLEAIRVGVNAILAAFTTGECQVFEAALDRWFVHNGDPSFQWHSFPGIGPNYPDRFFENDELNNGGYFTPNSDPGGAWAFGDTIGRHFVVRVPDLSAVEDQGVYPYAGVAVNGVIPELVGLGMFPGNGSSSEVVAIVTPGASALAIYRAIENFVNQVAGQSMRWTMLSDPML